MLNKAVKREEYVLPTIDDILPKLTGANPPLGDIILTDCPLGSQVRLKSFSAK